jgi:hypothetical protein
VCLLPAPALAQTDRQTDTRAQFPHWLENGLVAFDVGALRYPFSGAQLEPGQTARRVDAPPTAMRLALVGKEFSPFFSAQLTYLRPVEYVSYRGLNGTDEDRTVWMHYATLTARLRVPLAGKVGLYGEGGAALVTRSGFSFKDQEVVLDSMHVKPVLGAGLDLRFNDRWTMTGGATWIPAHEEDRQPRSLYVSGGVRYTMRRLPESKVAAVQAAGRIFPRTLVHLEATGGTGYSVNTFFARTVPIFWGGNVKVDQGLAVHVERNVFHSTSLFSIGFGVSIGAWKTRRDDIHFTTASIYPVLRFTVIRARAFDLYLMHSMAGPTFISKTVLDGHDTGRRFTFQDFMGVGLFAGRTRNVHLGVKINHYSNGNLFPQNAGVKIPLTLVAGITF